MGISSSKSTTGPSKFAQPYIKGAADSLQSAVAGNAPNVANLQSGLQGATGMLQDRLGGTELTKSAQDYTTSVLGGRYLNNNPFLEGMVGQARDGVFNDVATRFGRSGMAGSDGFGGQLGKGFADAELGLRWNDYNTERSRMDMAAGNAGAIANSDLPVFAAYSGMVDQTANLPLLGSRTLASGLGGLLGGYTTTKQSQPWGPMLLNGLSNAAQAYAGGG